MCKINTGWQSKDCRKTSIKGKNFILFHFILHHLLKILLVANFVSMLREIRPKYAYRAQPPDSLQSECTEFNAFMHAHCTLHSRHKRQNKDDSILIN